MAVTRPTARSVLRGGARALALASGVAGEGARRLAEADGGGSLAGDRSVEWSFCFARLADAPGSTLDFGAADGLLALAAAQRGHDVVALDLMPSALLYEHPRVSSVRADILDRPEAGRTFDQIVNCSTVEHVGLSGRYGSGARADGDLEAMEVLRGMLAPGGRMLLTVPVGRDAVFAPHHRVYGSERLPRLLAGYEPKEEQFWAKPAREGRWRPVGRDDALATEGSSSFYALGLLVLERG